MWNWVNKIVNAIKRPIYDATDNKREIELTNRIKDIDGRIHSRKNYTQVFTPFVSQTIVRSREPLKHALPNILDLKDIKSIEPSMMTLYKKHKKEDKEKKARKAAEIMINDIWECINTNDIDGARILYAETKSILMEYGTKKLISKLDLIPASIQELQTRLVNDSATEMRGIEQDRINEYENQRKKILVEEEIKRDQEKAKREKSERDSEDYLHSLEEKVAAENNRNRRLRCAHVILKNDKEQIKATFQENGIKYLYHITDSRNLFWINKYGGLLSFQFMIDEGIMTPYSGSTPDSIQRNEELNTSNYIKLYICIDKTILDEMKNKGITPMILSISPSNIVSYANTKFANESILRDSVRIGDNAGFLHSEIDWDQVKMNKVYAKEPFGFTSPEILVNTFIDKNEILNINNPKYV